MRVEPEGHPALYVFCGAVFALRAEPFDFTGGDEWCAAATAKADEYACGGEHSDGCLGDGGTSTQQDAGGVGDGDVPVLFFDFFFSEIKNAAVFLHDTAFFQVVDIRPLGMQDSF